MALRIIKGDITKLKVDAIVNAANTQLLEGGGVCGAIFRAAGSRLLQDACNKLSPIAIGDAVITPGFNLPSLYVIHAAGPVYDKNNISSSEKLLRRAYLSSLDTAKKNGCKSIAFPVISSGIYGYPKFDAMNVAIDTINEFLKSNDMEVYIVLFDEELCQKYAKD